MTNSVNMDVKRDRPEWLEIVKRYQQPNSWKSAWQLINTLLPFFIIWVLMYYSLRVSYFLTLGLGIINAGLLVRAFIIQHDCGHNSFFKKTKVNNFVGSILGVMTLTPYYHWRKQHARHHATSGDLDFRGIGDVDTMTVEEYQALSLGRKFLYRFYRHPFTLLVLSPTAVFVFMHRWPVKTKQTEKKERASVWWTNAAIAAIVVGLGLWLGFKEFALVQLPITIIGSTLGVYMFYVQHQFEDTYWRWHKEWDYTKAALDGCSYFKLPKILQWFTGNIGFHHVHHLSPKIPNYNLERAHNENEMFQGVETLTLLTSFRTLMLDLWDEKLDRLISFREYRKLYGAA